MSLQLRGNETAHEIITKAIGEQIIFFGDDEIRNEVEKHASEATRYQGVDSDELFALARSRVKNYPSISLVYIGNGVDQKFNLFLQEFSQQTQQNEKNITDGDLILIQRKSVSDLISDCAHIIWSRDVRYSMMMLRNGEDFIKNIRCIDE